MSDVSPFAHIPSRARTQALTEELRTVLEDLDKSSLPAAAHELSDSDDDASAGGGGG